MDRQRIEQGTETDRPIAESRDRMRCDEERNEVNVILSEKTRNDEVGSWSWDVYK